MHALTIIWDVRGEILAGFGNTLLLFVIAAPLGIALGLLVLCLLEGPDNLARRFVRLTLDLVRMLPCLIYAYILYYGLPVVGVRLDAWTAGCIALTTYHAAYFAEIFRGARVALLKGQAEAARAQGFRTLPMVFRILTPQLILSSGPVLGNQLIVCLKDTAFLMIISVPELTAAVTAVQAEHFIPLQAFVVAIALYWITTLFIAALVREVGRIALIRGLGYEQRNSRR